MSSLNKVMLIGRLGHDPKIRYTVSGDGVCNLSVATSESWLDKETRQKKKQTEWHRVLFFGKLAEVCGQYLHKGSMVYIEGSLQTRKWQDKSGQDRSSTEIRGTALKMLGDAQGQQQEKRDGIAPNNHPTDQTKPATPARPNTDLVNLDDDIPF